MNSIYADCGYNSNVVAPIVVVGVEVFEEAPLLKVIKDSLNVSFLRQAKYSAQLQLVAAVNRINSFYKKEHNRSLYKIYYDVKDVEVLSRFSIDVVATKTITSISHNFLAPFTAKASCLTTLAPKLNIAKESCYTAEVIAHMYAKVIRRSYLNNYSFYFPSLELYSNLGKFDSQHAKALYKMKILPPFYIRPLIHMKMNEYIKLNNLNAPIWFN